MGALAIYHRAALHTKFSGPTYFAGTLRRFLNCVEEGMKTQQKEFYVLVLLTDGCIHDIDNTIDLIVELSFKPVSIIIIGIGDEDFTDMITLDADSNILMDRNKRAACRDITQFVKFNDLSEMAQVEVNSVMMAEVPDQFVDYMVMKNLQLEPEHDQSDDEDPETLLNNYIRQKTNTAEKTTVGSETQ